MRYSLILAGGSGVRLWPMSREATPKQLIPFIQGQSLLQIAYSRLEGMIPPDRCYVCAGVSHREAVLRALPDLSSDRFLGEPVGRDTLNATGFGAAVIGLNDPEAVIAVFTADHLIEPVSRFQQTVARGCSLAEQAPNTLVTFGVEPTFASTGFGYLQLGEPIDESAFVVKEFKEKPEAATAQSYFESGPKRYLWNSGTFVWRAATLMECIRRYAPANFQGLSRIAEAWRQAEREAVLAEVYPLLKKVSVDYAVMEPASHDASLRVAALPMKLEWLDVGSWPSFAKTCRSDARGNALGADTRVLENTSRTLVVSSDPQHLIAALGCEDLIIVHTADATLVCRSDQAEAVKALQEKVGKLLGGKYV